MLYSISNKIERKQCQDFFYIVTQPGGASGARARHPREIHILFGTEKKKKGKNSERHTQTLEALFLPQSSERSKWEIAYAHRDWALPARNQPVQPDVCE